MTEEQKTKVTVKFNDGTTLEFWTRTSYETGGAGRLVYWRDATVEGKTFDFYVLSVATIRSIGEQEEA